MQLLAPANAWEPPLLIYSILRQPTKTLIRFLDLLFALLRTKPREKRSPIRVVCISDTHCLKWDEIPDGDLLIHAGDLTNRGTPAEIQAQINWLSRLPHKHKVVIAGNHDTYLDPRSRQTLPVIDQQGGLNWAGIHYLQHSSVTLQFNAGRRLKIHGAPQIPTIGNPDWAFRYAPESDAWSQTIPRDTDVLVTHTPPKYHLDLPSALGCPHLLREVWRTRPKLHVFGHVHAARTFWLGWLLGGRELARWDSLQHSVEQALTRPDGFVKGLLNPLAWLDVLKMIYFGTATLLWDRIWGGQGRATLMVNAALMYNSTGKLRNRPQVVDL